VPYNVFTLWNKYEFHPMFAAGVGVINQSYAYASSDNTVQLPGFTRVDAAIFGKFAFDGRKYRWQVNVENVFNQKYYSTADGNNNITPGSPTAVRGSITASF
jgi:catecholate siderophore receptor